MNKEMQMTPAAIVAFLSGDVPNAIIAATPGGIELQEKRGQGQLVKSDMIPMEIIGATKAQLETLGFVFGEQVDELFVACKLPRGWYKQASDHQMHSLLLDEQDRERAHVFYKAAFYDRRADISFQRRFQIYSYRETAYAKTYEVAVMDCKLPIMSFGTWVSPNYAACDALEAKAIEWLRKNKPEWQDVTKYW